MKKTEVLTLLSICFSVATYAQDSKMNASPAYDNVKKEAEWNTYKNELRQQKNILVSTTYNAQVTKGPVLQDNNKTGLSALQPHPENNPFDKYDLKRVVLRAVNYTKSKY